LQTDNRSGHKLCSSYDHQKFKRSQHMILGQKAMDCKEKSEDITTPNEKWDVENSICLKMILKFLRVLIAIAIE